ncbi:MAG: hypothetical protein M3321_11080, partial [Actinomycetota bacterium]|nr:hypothetical protein [Actinomycetota bacterium]
MRGDGRRRLEALPQEPEDAFAGDTPRPVAPELILRTWEVPTATATEDRAVMTSSGKSGRAERIWPISW